MSMAAIVRELLAAGVTGDALVAAIERIEQAAKPARSSAAERQKRYRDRQREGVETVTRDVTDVTNVTRDAAPLSPLMAPPKNISNPPLNPPNPPETIRARGALPKPVSGFAEFWASYPRKTAKAAAEKAWPKACQRMPPAEIIAATRRYADTEPDPQFIPHPATWLNQARFEDETDGNTIRQHGAGHIGQRSQPSGRLGAALELLAEVRAANAN